MTTKSKFSRFLMRSISCGITNQLGNKVLYRINLKTDLAALFLESIPDDNLRDVCKCTRCLDNLRQWGNTAYFDESRGTYNSVFFDYTGDSAGYMDLPDDEFWPFVKTLHKLLNHDPEVTEVIAAQVGSKPTLNNVGYEHFHIKPTDGWKDCVRRPDMPRVLNIQSRWFSKWGNNDSLIREASDVMVKVTEELKKRTDMQTAAVRLLRQFTGFESIWRNQQFVRTKAMSDGSDSMMLPVKYALHYTYTEHRSPYILSILDSLYSDPEGKYREGLVERTVNRILMDVEANKAKDAEEHIAHHQAMFDEWVVWLAAAKLSAPTPNGFAKLITIMADLDSIEEESLPLVQEAFDGFEIGEIETMPDSLRNSAAIRWMLSENYLSSTFKPGLQPAFTLTENGVLAKHLLAAKK